MLLPFSGRRAFAWFLAAATLTSCSGFRYETYVAELDGALEGVTTAARGRALLLVSRDESRAEISLSVSGFDSPISAAQIRRAPRGQTGPVVYTLWDPTQGAFGNSDAVLRVWTRGGNPTFDDAALQDLRAGNLYLTVQSRARPSGEVRGQLLPE
jgi:hypothetical protein